MSCDALRELMKDDIAEEVAKAVEEERVRALAEGQEIGVEKGEDNAFLSSIMNLMDTMKLTAEQAMDAIKIPAADRGKYAARL